MPIKVGKVEQTIITFMRAQDDFLGERMPVDTATLVTQAFGIKPPSGSANPPCGCYDPVQAAAYHTRCQSVRRALRSLDDKEYVRAFRDEGDDQRGWNYELT
jgi:hypothetical protein